jgi:hypothetical protein
MRPSFNGLMQYGPRRLTHELQQSQIGFKSSTSTDHRRQGSRAALSLADLQSWEAAAAAAAVLRNSRF